MKRVGKQQDVNQLGAGAGPRTLRRSRSRRSSSLGLIAGGSAVEPSLGMLGDLQPEKISLP